jgi:hypothetical protein
MAGRGRGAVATYVEDGAIWGTDGIFIASVAEDNYEYKHGAEEEDEQAHPALLTCTADAGSGSGSDGDGWMEQLGDDTACVAAVS